MWEVWAFFMGSYKCHMSSGSEAHSQLLLSRQVRLGTWVHFVLYNFCIQLFLRELRALCEVPLDALVMLYQFRQCGVGLNENRKSD